MTVEIDESDTARWLDEFLTPWFSRDDHSEPHHSVRVEISAERCADLDRRLRCGPTEALPFFDLDSQLLCLPGFRDNDDTIVLADTQFDCFYCLRGQDIAVVARPESPRFRVGLMRVVRELAAAQAGTLLDLHAAAFTVAGQAVLLLGEKRTGKTTLLTHALTSGAAELIANDRVLVTDTTPARAQGVPTVVVVREPTLRRFPALLTAGPRRTAHLHSGEIGAADVVDEKEGLAVSPTQLAQRLGAGVIGQAPVGAILFPEISSSIATWSLETISSDEGAARLETCRYGGRQGPRQPTLLRELTGAVDRNDLQKTALAQRLATQIPLLRCQLGPGAYRDHGWLRALPLRMAIR